MRKIALAATAIAALAVPAVAPVMASASPANQTYSVGTHSPGHLDTTSSAGPGTKDSPYGPVWAYDNLNLKYVVTRASATSDQWTVAVTAQGSFAGFADPTTGQAQNNSGSVNGNITYTVTSQNTPNMALVPSQEPSGSSIRLPIAQMFSLGNDPSAWNAIGGGDNYSFSYNKIDGKVYTQP